MQLEHVTQESEKVVCDVLGQIFMHIKSVQKDIAKLNFESMEKINDFVLDSGMEVDDQTFVALQHQDILTQQLGAVSELTDMLQKHLQNFDSYDTLESKFLSALEIAKAKKEAFRGNAF